MVSESVPARQICRTSSTENNFAGSRDSLRNRMTENCQPGTHLDEIVQKHLEHQTKTKHSSAGRRVRAKLRLLQRRKVGHRPVFEVSPCKSGLSLRCGSGASATQLKYPSRQDSSLHGWIAALDEVWTMPAHSEALTIQNVPMGPSL